MTATGQVLDEGVGVRETLLAVKDAYDDVEFCDLVPMDAMPAVVAGAYCWFDGRERMSLPMGRMGKRS